MKKLIILVCLLIYAPLTIAQEETPLLFINTNSYQGREIAPDKRLSAFADVAREVGYKVKHGWHWSITEESLKDVSVYVMPAYFQELTKEEKQVLRDYVKSGGKLLILSWYEGPSNLKGFIKEYGINYGEFDFDSQIGKIPIDSPVKKPKKCSVLQLDNHRRLTAVTKASARLLALDKGGFAAAIESLHKNRGKGKVVVCGDLGLFISPSYSVGNIEKRDNRAFVYNLLWHLQAAPDLAVKRLAKAGTSFVCGEKIAVKLSVSNTGDIQSEKATIHLFLSDSDNYDPEHDEELLLLKKFPLPAIAAGKTKKVRKKIKIPKIESGEYFLLVWIDKDEKLVDKNIANNLFFMKKPILVCD